MPSPTSSSSLNKEHDTPLLFQSIKRSIHQLLPNNHTNHSNNVAKFLTGTAAFYTTSFLSQCLQYKLSISTGTRPVVVPTLAGVATVAVGSYAGHIGGVVVQSCRDISVRSGANVLEAGRTGYEAVRECIQPMKFMFRSDERLSRNERREKREVWFHAAGICIIGLLSYKTILRSRFTSLSPSSYTARGSFARAGIPAPNNYGYATPSQRAALDRLGRTWGCHTCGSRMLFSNSAGKNNGPRFHGDHIPPVSVAKLWNERWYRKATGWTVNQKFYPQCRDCSNRQGGLLSRAVSAGRRNLHSAGGGGESHFHGRRIRIGHLAGGIVAVTTVGEGVDGKDIVIASRERVRRLRDWFADAGWEWKDRFESWWK